VIEAGHVTFGCFNAQPKINEPLLKLWSEILRATPGSRLLLKNRSALDSSTQQHVRAVLETAGIGSDRIELAGHTTSLGAHLASYSRVDIALDTFPYHGTTTTCEALWMGVPVITLAGQTHVSRVGVSLLSHVGLPELVAESPADYVRLATELASDLPRLAALRRTLRPRMAASPLTDAPRFARAIEAAYREMWREWCAQQPSHFPAP
jgi:predicted O-linked N-acetylglucosamine transferase (SPINDLY family)